MSSPDRPAPRRWRHALAVVAAAVLLKLLYLALACPYTLVEDEAHYWEWSRRLDWSYYTKGPGIAATIWASTNLGRLVGIPDGEFTVRAPAAIASGVLMLALALLTRSIARRIRPEDPAFADRAALAACLVTLLAPGFHLISVLITIDGPYAASWALAALAGWHALRNRSAIAWPALGAAIALGFVYKYTILLLPPGLALFALANRAHLRLHPRWKPLALLALLTASLGLLPVLVWNAQNDWGTVRHLLGHLGLAGGDMAVTQDVRKGWSYSPEWTLVLLAAQLGLMGGALPLALWAWRRLLGPKAEAREARPDVAYLLACAAPIFAFYLGVSFLAEPEGNWPLAGHVTLIPLAAIGARLAIEEARRRRAAGYIRPGPGAGLWGMTVVTGVVVVAAALRADWAVHNPASRWFSTTVLKRPEGQPLVPLGRLTSADRVALDADRLRKDLDAATGQRAFIVAQQYGRASLLAFYVPGHPIVYCSSSRQDGRRTQYDLWPDTSLDDPALRGRPAVLVGGRRDQWEPLFDRLVEHGPLDGEPKRGRITWIGYGFRGFPAPAPSPAPSPAP